MALTNRQDRLYRYTVSIYRHTFPPNNSLYPGGSPVLTDAGVYTLVASGVKGMLAAQPDNAAMTAVGRSAVDNLFTMDLWKFQSSVDIGDTDCILCTAVSNSAASLVNRVWVVQGDPRYHDTHRKSNNLSVNAKLESKVPPGIP